MRRDWLLPLTGVAFIVLLIVGFAVAGDAPESDKGGQEIIDWYVDNKDSASIGSGIVAAAAVFFVFFANYFRGVVRDNASGPELASATILAGASIVAVGAAFDSTLVLGLAQAADHLDPAAAQAIGAIWDNDFLPLAIGAEIFIISSAAAILRGNVLPRWLGWAAVVIAIAAATPAGFVAFIATGVWIIVASVMLSLRTRGAGTPPAAAAGAA
jgi:hypothetical protein